MALKDLAKQHGSKACVVGVLIGLGLSVVETWRARPKFDAIMKKRKEEKEDIEEDSSLGEEEKKEKLKKNKRGTVKDVTLTVLPIAATVLPTAGLAVAGHVIDSKRIGELSATLALTDTAYNKLLAKTTETLGVDATNEVKTAIAKEDIQKQIDDSKFTTVIDTGDGVVEISPECAIQAKGGNQLFYDFLLGRIFKSDVTTIQKACVEANLAISSGAETYLTYDEFCTNYLDLPSVVAAEAIGVGGHSLVQKFEPNLANAVIVNDEVSVIVLDWRGRPNATFK